MEVDHPPISSAKKTISFRNRRQLTRNETLSESCQSNDPGETKSKQIRKDWTVTGVNQTVSLVIYPYRLEETRIMLKRKKR